MTIKKPSAVESPYVTTDTTPTRLASSPVAGGGVSTVAATVSATASVTANANTTSSSTGSNVSYYTSGIEGIAGLANYGRVFDGANVYVTLEQPQYNTYNTNYAGSANVGGANGQVQFNDAGLFAGSASLTFDGANLVVGGKITGTQLSTTGNITGGYFIGNGSQLTGISASSNKILNGNSYANIASANGSLVIGINGGNTWTFDSSSTLTAPGGSQWQNAANADAYFTSSLDGYVHLQSLFADGNVGSEVFLEHGLMQITAHSLGANTDYVWTFDNGGNLTLPGNTFQINYANGSPVSLVSTYGNANVVANLAALGSNPVSTTGNITGNNIIGAAANIPSVVSQNLDVENISARGSAGVNIGAGGFNNLVVEQTQVLIQNVPLSVSGNVIGGNVLTGGVISATANITGGNILTGGLISVTGNITGGNVSTGVITLTNGAVIKDNAGESVAFGQSAGGTSQGNSAVALGQNAGATGQGTFAVAIGRNAGQTTQGGAAVAIGVSAGDTSQGNSAVAIGQSAGFTNQSANTVAVGVGAGQSTQGVNAVAIGNSAGSLTQGIAAVAIGALAGRTFQANNSIIINATGANLDQTTANTFTVAPVRNDVANIAEVMFYNATSKEITYGNTISVAGNITGGNVNTGAVANTGNLTFTAGANSWTFDTTGNLTVPGSIILPPNSLITGNFASPAPRLSNFDSVGAVNLSASGNVTSVRISASGNVTANNVSLTGNGFVSFTSGSQLTFGDTPVTNRYYIDATRTDTYTANGSQSRPFKTIAAAQAAIATAIAGGLNPEVEPIYMILLSNITENVTLATNHVYLIGQNGQIHQPIILTGNITVQPTSGTLNSNHFSISGMEIVGGTNGKAIYVTGTFPTRLSLQDMWITANGNSGAGLYQDNSGTGTYTHGGPLKVSHNGTGDVYCFDIRAGTASFDTVETSGATQVGAAGPGATLTFNNSQLDANGNVVIETYGNGVVVVTNSVIKNSAANSSGIRLNAVANVAGTASVGQSAFNIPLGTGKAVWLDPNTTPGLSGVFAWSGASFYPSTNTTIDTSIIPGPLAILVGTQVSPIFYGDITSYAVAQDWDLIDNNASALSFDTTGKAGVLELVTTNSAEGVKMSGFASAAGNVTGGNVTTAGLTSTASLSITGNTATVTTANYSIGYLNVPQVSLSSNSTVALTDSGKHYYSVSASNLALTIANNTSVSWPVGTAISIVNGGTANILINQGTGVSIYLAGNATAGNRVLATFGMATIMNTAANVWFINGTGLT